MAAQAGLTRARDNIRWVEEFCRVPEGRDVGKPLKLRKWQKDIIRGIYGTPTRRAIISFGRKNGKTALAACLCLLHLVGPEHRRNSQLFSAAQSRDQAALVFGLAAKMVRMNPDLAGNVVVRDTSKQLFCPELGTLYRALSAEAPTAFGLSPVFVVHDELGQVNGPRSPLFEALETASAAHEEPLSLIISTQAPTDADLLSLLIEHAGKTEDPRYKLFLWAAPEDSEPFTVKAIKAANPAFGDFQNEAEVRRMADEARDMPSRENEYRNLILNQRVSTQSSLISPSVWKENGGEPDGEFDDLLVWGGLDLSQRRDTSALVWLADNGGVLDVAPRFWLPERGIKEKAHNDRAPYDLWAADGLIRLSPGETVNYMEIAEEIVRAVRDWDVRKIGYDPYLVQALWPCLDSLGMDEEERESLFVKFPQTYTGMSSAISELLALLQERKLRHGNHAVLTSHAVNAVAHRGPVTDQILIKKAAENRRIDGAVALAMAVGVRAMHIEEQAGPSFWEVMAAE